MAQENGLAGSLATIGANFHCMDPIIRKLKPEQLCALHACGHEIITSIFRLYMTVPHKKADVILAKYFKLPGAK